MKHLKSLRSKFVSTMLLVSGIIGVFTLAIVVFMSAQSSAQHLLAMQRHLEQGITSKGKVVAENHALALRGLSLDNAFLDMQRLVERAVHDDEDLVYGLYVNSDREALAYARRGAPQAPDAKPSADAVRELGMAEEQLIVTRSEVRHTRRLGQDLLEVAAPVLGEDSEVVGTVRYGLSMRRMHEAVAQAKAEENARLQRSLWMLGALVGFSTLLGSLLSRVQAVRITRPIDALTSAAERLASGDRSVQVEIRSGDELERLGAAFNHMVADLDRSYSELQEMNRTLEHKVEQRTRELASKNRDMRLVLDNVDQGFVTLGMDGKMARERSRVVDEWFGACETQLAFGEYIGHSASLAFGLTFQLGWEQVVEDSLPLDAAISQLPARLTAGLRSWDFRYLPFFKDGKMDGLLVVIADVGERLAKEREEAEQSELMQVFKKLMLDRSGFTIFLREASQMVEAICTRRLDAEMVLLKRTIHTLKGNSASMGLGVVAGLCHTLEEQLADADATSDKTLSELYARWTAMNEHIVAFSGDATQRMVEIPKSEYAALVSRLSDERALRPDLLRQILAWQLEPVARPLKRLGEQAKQIARRLDKGELLVKVDANNVRLDPDIWTPFFSELIHLIRNAVDHGIESPDERAARGKPLQGTLLLKAVTSASQLTFEIGDDGRGIDWDAIARQAAAFGLPHERYEDLVDALCADGVTTRRSVSSYSGRGVGLAAVRQRIHALGGRLEVRSVRGVGTSLLMRFPCSPQESPGVKSQRPSRPPLAISSLRGGSVSPADERTTSRAVKRRGL